MEPGARGGHGGHRDLDVRVLWAVAVLALLSGMAASVLHGPGRRLGQLVVLLLGLGMAAFVSRRSYEVDDLGALGGTGYDEGLPTPPPVKLLHAAITLLYNVGLMVVVFAFLVRVHVVPTRFDPGLVQVFPFFLGLFVLLLALATGISVRARGGVLRAWYTRVHGWFLGVVGGLVALGGVVLLFDPVVALGGSVFLVATDLPVLVTVGLLGVSTQMFLAAGLPTVLDLVHTFAAAIRRQRRGTRRPATAATPPFVYAAILAVGAATLLSILASQFDLLETLGGFRDERVVYVIAVVPLALALFFLTSAVGIYREGRRGLYTKKISRKLRNDIIVFGFSSLAGLFFLVLLTLHLGGDLDRLGPFSTGNDVAKDLVALTILATTGPIGVYLHKQIQRVDAIESRMPDFLNDLAESRRAGLTLSAGLQAAARSDYGALSPEVRKMANQVAWGVPFNDALKQFGDRVKTNLVRRSVQLIIEASRTGGSISQILKASARDAHDLKSLEADRRVTMMTFLIVIYVVFFVFIVVLASLDTQFIPQVLAASEAAGESAVGVQATSPIDAESINFIYYNAAMVQAVGNGIVGGVLAEGRVTAGFRHVAFMTFCAWVAFRFILGGL